MLVKGPRLIASSCVSLRQPAAEALVSRRGHSGLPAVRKQDVPLALLPKQIMDTMLVTLLVGRDLSGDSSSFLSSLIGLCVQCAGGGPEPVQRVVQPGQRTAQGQQGRLALDDLASLATESSIEKVLQPPRVLLGLSHSPPCVVLFASVCRSMTRCRASRRRSSSTPASLPPGTGLVRYSP